MSDRRLERLLFDRYGARPVIATARAPGNDADLASDLRTSSWRTVVIRVALASVTAWGVGMHLGLGKPIDAGCAFQLVYLVSLVTDFVWSYVDYRRARSR